MGQLHLKRYSKGAALIVVTSITVIIPLYLFFQKLAPLLIDSILLQGRLAPSDVLQKIWLAFTMAFHTSPWTFLICLITFILVWLYGMAEVILSQRRRIQCE